MTPYSQHQLAQWAKEEFRLTAKPSQFTISVINKEKKLYMQMGNEQLDVKCVKQPFAPKMEDVFLTFVDE